MIQSGRGSHSETRNPKSVYADRWANCKECFRADPYRKVLLVVVETQEPFLKRMGQQFVFGYLVECCDAIWHNSTGGITPHFQVNHCF